MISARTAKQWMAMVPLCLSLGTQAVATEPLTVTFSVPAADATVSSDFSIAIRITEGSRPFTEAGARRWVQATVRKRGGQTVAQLPLRDHGQGSDRLRGDGEWTASTRIHLPDGQYSLAILIQRGDERYLPKTSFAVSTAHAPPSATTGEAGASAGADLARVDARLGELAAQMQALADRAPASGGRPDGGTVLLGVVVSILALSAILALVLVIRLWMRRPTPVVAGARSGASTPQPTPPGSAEEKWRPLFRALESLQTAVTEMRKDLSGTFQVHQVLMDQRKHLAEELVSLSQSLASVDTLAAPATQGLKAHFRHLLAEAGIEAWEPAVGVLAPPDCEQRPDPEDRSAPPQSVTEVLMPGFRMRHGEGWIVLVRPVVAVATGTQGGGQA